MGSSSSKNTANDNLKEIGTMFRGLVAFLNANKTKALRWTGRFLGVGLFLIQLAVNFYVTHEERVLADAKRNLAVLLDTLKACNTVWDSLSNRAQNGDSIKNTSNNSGSADSFSDCLPMELKNLWDCFFKLISEKINFFLEGYKRDLSIFDTSIFGGGWKKKYGEMIQWIKTELSRFNNEFEHSWWIEKYNHDSQVVSLKNFLKENGNIRLVLRGPDELNSVVDWRTDWDKIVAKSVIDTIGLDVLLPKEWMEKLKINSNEAKSAND